MPNRLISRILEQKESVILEETTTITAVAEALAKSSQNAVLIHSGGRTVGIITEADIIHRVVAKGLQPAETTASSVMTTDTVVVRPNRPLGHALYLMREYGVHHIPVVDQGKPLGVICATDALPSDLEEYAHEAEIFEHIAEML